MQYRCSDVGIADIKLRCSLFSSLAQPVLSYDCKIWRLERPNDWCHMLSIHHMFMKCTLHVRRSTPSGVVLCELGQVPLPLFWCKMLLQYVGRLVDLPNDQLVKQALTHAQQQKTSWFQKLFGWLSDYDFHSLIATGTFSVSNAMTTLRDKGFNQVCQLDLTKVKFSIDMMFFDSDQMAKYLSARPSPALFALINFRLGSHRPRVETDRVASCETTHRSMHLLPLRHECC